MSKTPFMGTTEIAPTRSLAGICDLLIRAGARQINQTFGPDGKVIGVAYTLIINQQVAVFQLPARVDPVYRLLTKRKSLAGSEEQKWRERAERVAWRQLFRWVEAQIAMIETGMAEAGEVFAPYLTDSDGNTLWAMLSETRFKALPAPEKEPCQT